MRYLVAAFLLFVIGLPLMNVWAAPAPAPSAILQIPPPPKGETAEQFLKDQIEGQTGHAALAVVISDPEVKKLPSVARFKDARPWLAKNIRVTALEGGRRLRLTFQAGSREEQVAILNAWLRENLLWHELSIKSGEEWIGRFEKKILELEKQIKSTQDPKEVASLRRGVDNLRNNEIPVLRAAIAWQKQFVVNKWAK